MPFDQLSGIVAYAFAEPADVPTNNRLKAIAEELAMANGSTRPIYTQRAINLNPPFDVVYTKEEPNSPPPTLRISREAAKWAKQNGLRHLWIVAAKPHLWRCERDLRKAIAEAGVDIEIHIPQQIADSDYMSWFEPQSTQRRTQSFRNWWLRELILRFMPFWLYKRTAS